MVAKTMTEALPTTRAAAKAEGAPYYFTGKPCKHGHVGVRWVSSGICKECHAASFAAQYAKNPGKFLSRRSAWAVENPEKVRALNAAWRKANREKARAWSAAWAAANPDKVRAIRCNRRARKRNAEGTCSADEATAIRASQKDRCAYCRVQLKGKGHLDHIIPLIRGGSNWPRNLQWLCQTCNNSKFTSDPIDFARRNGMLL